MSDWGLWRDDRIPGRERLIQCNRLDLMQVPDTIRKCVCFVQVGWGDDVYLGGTAMFIAHGPEHAHHVYAVTCAHVLSPGNDEDGKQLPPFTSISLVVNRHDGPAIAMEVPTTSVKDTAVPNVEQTLGNWVIHSTCDVAAYAILPPWSQAIYDYLKYPITGAADAAFLAKHRIGPPEDIFMTGLLHTHPGWDRIEPVVRRGSIAGIPSEPIWLDDCVGPQKVILAEIHSIGGLSGSPVFFPFPDTRRDDEGEVRVLNKESNAPGSSGPNYLLGMLHGLFPNDNDPDFMGARNEPLNTGISIVLPVERIVELLDSPPFADLRAEIDRLDEVARKKPKVKPVRAPRVRDEEAISRDQFLDAARKVSKPMPRPEREA